MQFFFQILGILKINFYICKRNCVAPMGTLGCERQMKVFRENGKARGWVYPISATL